MERTRALLVASAIVLAGAVALSWPALANGYPLLFPDSGAYVENSYTLKFYPARAIGYPLFLRWTRVINSLWVPVAVQALLTSFLVVRTAMAAAPGRRHLVAASALVAVLVLTGAAKYVSWIMPDIFAAWLFLGGALYLLAERRFDRVVAGLAVFSGVVVHSAHFPLALATGLLVLAVAAIRARRGGPRRPAIRALVLVAVVGSTVPAMYLAHRVYGHDRPPVGGHPMFLVNRFLGAGVLVPTLDRYGGEKHWALCRYRDVLAAHQREGSDWFLWGRDSPRRQLPEWTRETEAEYSDIVRCALKTHPKKIASATVAAAWRQFWRVRSDDGLEARSLRFLEKRTIRRLRHEVPALLAADQASGRRPRASLVPVGAENAVFVVAFVLAAAGAVACGRSGRRRPALLFAALAVFLALNALLVGFASSPHDRYQGRIAWLVTFVLVLEAWSLAVPPPPSPTPSTAEKRPAAG